MRTCATGGGLGFFDPHGWCDERYVPLVLDGTQRQSSVKISLDPLKKGRRGQVDEDTAASCVELMLVNELRGAEGCVLPNLR